jgi:paraquat-inducible protein B
VLVEIDPSLLRREAAEKISKPDGEFLKDAVARGLRAALKTGSLLTGALFVDLDYYKDTAPAELTKTGDYSSIPTVSSGLAQLEAKLTAILDKVQALPLEDTMKKIARKTLDSEEFARLPADLRNTIGALEKSVSSVGPDGAIQGDLLRTLDELRAALRSIKGVTNTLEEKPNSLIFGKDKSGNSIPKAPKAGR